MASNDLMGAARAVLHACVQAASTGRQLGAIGEVAWVKQREALEALNLTAIVAPFAREAGERELPEPTCVGWWWARRHDEWQVVRVKRWGENSADRHVVLTEKAGTYTGKSFDAWKGPIGPHTSIALPSADDVYGILTRDAPPTAASAPESDEAEFELAINGNVECGASGPREKAWREIQHYAAQYALDGDEVQIYQVTRKLVQGPPTAASEPAPEPAGESAWARWPGARPRGEDRMSAGARDEGGR